MIQTIPLTPQSDVLCTAARDAAEGAGLLFVLDCSGDPPAEPWLTWIADATEQILVRVSGDLQEGHSLPTILGIIRVSSAATVVSSRRGAVETAAVEAIRGTLGAVALELAAEHVRANVVVVDDETPVDDLRTTVRYLLDDGAAGFTTGATLRLTLPGGPAGMVVSGRGSKRAVTRRALVTGATGGLGFAASVALKRVGYELVAADLETPRLFEVASQLGATPLAFDVSDVDQVRSAASAINVAGGLQVLAIHHGIDGSGSLRDLSPDRIRKIMAINGTAVAALIDAFLPALYRGAPSVVVAVASQAGIKAEPYNSAYCAAKFGVVGLIRGLAPVLVANGVRIHALCPGCTDTPLLAAAFEGFARGSGKTASYYREQRTALIPVQRLGSPDEMGAATAYLCQLEGATGVVLAPSGGETLS